MEKNCNTNLGICMVSCFSIIGLCVIIKSIFSLGRDMSNRIIFFYTHTSIENQLVITFQALGGIDKYMIKLCFKGQNKCSHTFKVDLSIDSTYSERLVEL